MPISGLVITVANEADTLVLVRSALALEPGLTLGETQGPRIPAVLEAADEDASKLAHDRLVRMPGVVQVDVVFVGFDEAEPLVPLEWRGSRS